MDRIGEWCREGSEFDVRGFRPRCVRYIMSAKGD